jgi:isoquinoline 1-oxidoreductase beta subunit
MSRRTFLKTSLGTGAGLTLGVWLPAFGQMGGPGKAGTGVADGGFEPNAFVRIGPDNVVEVVAKHLEMGQGSWTGLATLVAEELDADWEQVRVVGAPADAARYNNLFWGPVQGTGGSTAMANSHKQMREAGAAARAMLTAAAAERWSVDAESITIEQGILRGPSPGQTATFGDLAEAAAAQPVPEIVFLKDPADFRLIGRHLPRKDNPGKVNGTALYTQDVRLPEMLTAAVLHAPRFGGRLAGFDAAEARKVKGVVDVFDIPSGVAVVATDTWAAISGRDAVRADWDDSAAFSGSAGDLMASYRALADQPGATARLDGDPAAVVAGADGVLTADYEFPFLAHAAMEPMNCVVRIDASGCEIFNGEQLQTGDQAAVAQVLGIEPDQVRIHMLYAGGSFGRRANPKSDYVVEAVHIARRVGKPVPVKLVWTREDDMRAGFYRPMYFHRLSGVLGADGMPLAWQHRIVGQSIVAGTAFEQALVKNGIDGTSVEGAASLPYGIPNLGVDLHSPAGPVPVQWWRAVGSTHTAFSTETFLDELAVAAGQDPVDYRLKMLADHPRHARVLQLAAEKGGWGAAVPEGQFRGVALHESFSTRVAQVADVRVEDDGTWRVHRVVIAVDCGMAVNPDLVRAQMEGGMGFGLSAALGEAISFEDGRVVEGNFDGYPVLRMDQMPQVEVHIVASTAPPTGVGEPATPVIAPAVAVALHRATGQRLRSLPLKLA